MNWIRIWVVGLCVSLAGATALGQIVQLPTEADFANDRITLNFNSQQEGADAGNLFLAYGIRIRGIGGGNPTIRADLVAGQPFNYLSNEAEAGADITSQVVIDFASPVTQMGFQLRHAGDSPAMASFQFRNVRGDNIGVIQTQVTPGFGPFVGFQAPAGEVFSRVVFNYGDAPSPEQFFSLVFTYAQRPEFTTYVPQIADGELPGSGALRSTIVIANLADTTVTGQLSLFGDDGQPLSLQLNDTTSSQFELQLPPRGVLAFRTSGMSSPPVQGYACIETNFPVSATGIFQILDQDGRPVSEAGVEATAARHQQVATVIREAGVSLDSGIAIANISDMPANGIIQLLDPSGIVVASNNTFGQLPARGHSAGFLGNLFPQVGPDFRGTILIFSDQPMAAVVLRTARGLVLSSLPVGSVGR